MCIAGSVEHSYITNDVILVAVMLTMAALQLGGKEQQGALSLTCRGSSSGSFGCEVGQHQRGTKDMAQKGAQQKDHDMRLYERCPVDWQVSPSHYG